MCDLGKVKRWACDHIWFVAVTWTIRLWDVVTLQVGVPYSRIMKAETFARPNNGDVHQGWAILAICWAFIVCALVSTILRVWVRWRITRNMGSDDWVMVVAMVRSKPASSSSIDIVADHSIQATSVLGAGLITAQVLSGLGRHSYYLTPAQRRNFQALGWADWIQTFITLALMKISICLFLLRISDARNVVRGMYAIIAFVTLFTLVVVFLFLGVCRPLRSHWTVGVDGVCLSKRQLESIVLAQGGELDFATFDHENIIY